MIYQIPAGTGFEMRRKIFPALVFPPVLWYAGIRQKTTGVDTMAEQEMLLDTATIRAAVAGEKWAKDHIGDRHDGLISVPGGSSLRIFVLFPTLLHSYKDTKKA